MYDRVSDMKVVIFSFMSHGKIKKVRHQNNSITYLEVINGISRSRVCIFMVQKLGSHQHH